MYQVTGISQRHYDLRGPVVRVARRCSVQDHVCLQRAWTWAARPLGEGQVTLTLSAMELVSRP